VLGALAQQIGRLAHDAAAFIGRLVPPDRKPLHGGGQRAVEIRRARVRQPPQHLLVRRIDHVLAGTAVAVEPLAVDIESELRVHDDLLAGFRGTRLPHR